MTDLLDVLLRFSFIEGTFSPACFDRHAHSPTSGGNANQTCPS
ncbi:Hypothetical protein Cul131001_2148 [Corynebacterium ulcerans]|nr:Hypothetical protein Cul131001_2148 [Corynebacterium ulcerans]